ncbi:FAD dependent oxidoreductase [Aspergillus tamarii]|uniref:FAD dependent oxidoreductase n=1 Tax=Aspergillus tamarii TaxID=41984 RepID=A0A5N6V421_ASPTM|nr:FAD dependent oxidoreductase [Aspergillus tamarii]
MSDHEVDEQALLNLITQDPGLPRDNPTAAYWQHIPHRLSNAQSPSLPQTTDVAVIGSGITGVSVAKTILEQDETATVTVFDARTLCSGATGRNGGQLAINAAESYLKLKKMVGVEMAGKIIHFNLKTLEAFRRIAAQLASVQDSEVTDVVKIRSFKDEESFQRVRDGIDALEADHPSLRGLYTVLGPEACQQEHGVHGVSGAVLHSAGTVWPYRVVTNAFDDLLSRYPSRLSIETNTPVTEVIYGASSLDSKNPYILTTPRGIIRAAQVAYCTNGYTGHLLPALRGVLFPMKGTMTVQDLTAIPSIPNRGSTTSWAIHYPPLFDAATGGLADGLIYGMQNVKTGWHFFGGEKSPPEQLLSSDDTILSQSSVQFLQESLDSLFGLREPARKLVSAWSGVMGFTSDTLPLVGKLPSTLTGRDGQGEWFSGGYNGYGMPSAWLAGESLGLMILGQSPREYLPEAYLISEERLRERLTVTRSMEYLSEA